ncbi:MAG TPA: TIGR00730 family Rossman fold protein [Rhodothermales bacterium]|nr:TIGR00730 family Rossman fold protein [Rhodothermales bacterium]
MAAEICVYCSSSTSIQDTFVEAAEQTGRLLADRGYHLVFGGGSRGLMGTVARAVQAHGGYVFGVIPEALKSKEGIAYELADELVVTQTMQERKAIMFTRADAFIVLPGGFGTLEELMEVLTLKILGYHDKAIALINTDGFYDPLLKLFEHFYHEHLAHEYTRGLYHIVSTPDEALAYIEQYHPPLLL